MKHKDVWIRTYSGIKFYPFNPKIENILIEDIAHSLSNQCRFSGHSSKFYSVAQHCCFVADICSEENKMWGLIHDATEAYFIDVPSPIKKAIKEFKNIENTLSLAIAEKFNLPSKMPEEVHEADRSIFNVEWVSLMNGDKGFFDFKTKYFKLKPETPSVAKKNYIKKYNELLKIENKILI